MKSIFFRGLIVFFILLITSSLMIDVFNTNFGQINYWQNHGIFFLIFLALLPRVTLLLSSVVSGGLVWWLGLIICPRLLIASLATIAYFQTNPLLVVLSWLVALSGEVFEKWGLGRNRFIVRSYRFQGPQGGPRSNHRLSDEDTIEAEYTRKD